MNHVFEDDLLSRITMNCDGFLGEPITFEKEIWLAKVDCFFGFIRRTDLAMAGFLGWIVTGFSENP